MVTTTKAQRTEKPWGWELLWAEAPTHAGKILHIRAGEALSLQFHERKDETIHVLTGRIQVDLELPGHRRERVELGPGDGLRIPPLAIHRMIAVETSEVLEASTPELDDVVRLEDRYGRAGGSELPAPRVDSPPGRQ